MVNRVAKPQDVLSLAVSLAEKLAALARPAMAATKRLFHEVADLPLEAALERGRNVNQSMGNFEKLKR